MFHTKCLTNQYVIRVPLSYIQVKMQVFIQIQFVDVSHTVKAPKAMLRIFMLPYHNLTYANF